MKVLVVLSAFVASCLVSPSFGYTFGYSAYAPYSAISPLVSGIGPLTPYALNAPIISPYAAAPYAAAPYAAVPYAAAPAVIPAPVAGVKTQYHSQNELGEAAYGHTEPTQSHHAIQDAAGNKVGSYSYIGQSGEYHQTNYVADAAGYRVAANDLPVDTPAVLAAKAQHFAAKLAAPLYRRKRSLFSSNVGGWGIPAVLANGHIADTPEVAAAKAQHFAEVAKASGHSFYAAPAVHAAPAYVAPAAPAYHGYYAGSYAQTVVRPDGFLADTPEVAAAKAAHYAEKAKVTGLPVGPAVPYTPYASQYTHASGPWAVPVVKPDGFLADTPEVAAAKSAHLAELHSRGKRSITPAATSLLPFAAPAVAYSAYTPAHVAYSAPIAAYSTPVAYSGYPALKTVITHNPFHAVSERIDPVYPYAHFK